MKTYKIKQTSVFLWIVSLLGTIFLGMGLIASLVKTGLIPNPKGHPFLAIALIAPIMFFAWKVPHFIASVNIELAIDSVGLKKKWLKHFLFFPKPNIDISWTEIRDYVFEPDRQFDKFKLTLKNGTKFKLHHNTYHDGKDDFQQFQLDFQKKIAKLNSDKDTSNDIKLGKTIYETAWGLMLAIISLIMIVAVVIVVLFFPTKKGTNYALLISSISGTVYFIFQVYDHRKKNKDK